MTTHDSDFVIKYYNTSLPSVLRSSSMKLYDAGILFGIGALIILGFATYGVSEFLTEVLDDGKKIERPVDDSSQKEQEVE